MTGDWLFSSFDLCAVLFLPRAHAQARMYMSSWFHLVVVVVGLLLLLVDVSRQS